MDYWFACCCFQNCFIARSVLQNHYRINDNKYFELELIELLFAQCFDNIFDDYIYIALLMKLLANTKIPEPTDDVRYLLNSSYIKTDPIVYI